MKSALPPPHYSSPLLAAAVLSLLGMASSPAAPGWWSEPATSIAGDTPVNDWAAANLGQLKHVATQAKAHLDFTLASIGGAGPEIDAMCQFTQQDNYAPAAVGQLKNVAKVFYDRLAQAQWNWQTGYPGTASTPYPWTGTVHAENAAPINIGQLKNVFSFDLSSWASFDQDSDSMADGWEVYYGLNPGNSADGDLDWDNDGLTNREEYNANANPLTADTDGDFSPDAEEVEEGTDPRRNTSAPVTLCAVYDSVHWLMDYLPPANPQPWEISHPIWYEYFQRWDGQAAAIRPGGRGGPLYDPPGSLSGQASLIDTAATLTAWNVRWDHTTVLRSEAGFHSDGEGSARTSAARLWLRGPKSSSPVTRTFVKLVRREVPPVPPLSGITEEYSTVTFTIPANQNYSAPQSFTATLSPAEPARSYAELTDVSFLPVELHSDLNNDGQLTNADSILVGKPYVSGATEEEKERGTEFMFADDNLSNGAWDKEDMTTPGKPVDADDDDVEELYINPGITEGKVWLDHPAIHGLKFYLDKKCTLPIDLSPSQRFTINPSSPFPGKVFVRAESVYFTDNNDPQIVGSLKLMVQPIGHAANGIEATKIKLIVVKEIGASKFFKAVNDSINEQNLELFVKEVTLGTMQFRVCLMLLEKTQISCLNAWNLPGPPFGITYMSTSNSTALINGNVVFHSGVFGRMTDRCYGRIVLPGGTFDSTVSSDDDSSAGSPLAGPSAKYFYQTLPAFGVGTRRFFADVGRLPTSGVPDLWSGMGGGSTNYASSQRQGDVQMIGFARDKPDPSMPNIDRGIVFTATSWTGSGSTKDFADRAHASGVETLPTGSPGEYCLLMVDGGSSLGLMHRLPSGSVGSIYLGARQRYGVPEYTNTFISFSSVKPR